jgi:hypothetical protein
MHSGSHIFEEEACNSVSPFSQFQQKLNFKYKAQINSLEFAFYNFVTLEAISTNTG